MAKLAATELAKRCALEGVQIMGGYGYATEYPMERHLRAAVVTTIYGGTSEIQKNIIAKTLGPLGGTAPAGGPPALRAAPTAQADATIESSSSRQSRSTAATGRSNASAIRPERAALERARGQRGRHVHAAPALEHREHRAAEQHRVARGGRELRAARPRACGGRSRPATAASVPRATRPRPRQSQAQRT